MIIRLEKTMKVEKEKELLDVFRKVEINIPLLDAIKQILKYAKFLKDLCTHKRKLRGDERVEDIFELKMDNALAVALVKHLELGATLDVEMSDELYRAVETLHSLPPISLRYEITSIFVPETQAKLLPSIVQIPELELKPFPKHLKYAFFGDNETLPVIISAHLSPRQKDNPISLFRDHKEAIGWSIANIKRISPSLCMHRIWLKDDAKSIKQAQQRLNLLMIEVEKKEILKLLKVGIIFAISDSSWVNPVQIVSKKAGITVEENQEDEMVPVRKPTGWRQCIDYRRLNAVMKNDHFSLPFIDQMIERLAGHVYYCFLDDFSDYFQIAIAPKDRKKTTFTCLFGTFAYRRMPFDFCNAPATFQRCMGAFDRLKESLTSLPVIQPPDWSLPFEIMCDASDYAVGAVLGQRVSRTTHTIYYASKALNKSQLNYSTTEKELLVVIFALEKFRPYLFGAKVSVFSDHTALRYLMTKKDAKPRLIRWILILQEFKLETKDKSGAENLIVDHLSCLLTHKKEQPLRKTFPEEQLFAVDSSAPWYADMINFLVTNQLLAGWSKAGRDKLKSDAKYYIWDDPYLWRQCSDQILRKCASAVEIQYLKMEKKFVVNGHCLKPYYEWFSVEEVKVVQLQDPLYLA
ncbi:uncharacterized protein [Coffea arabica]|uniref:Reverse transcriptase n=1 Tax=Coffea arabica TaxID=13443 RepID=A0ABM4X5S6_COFAR